MKISLYTVLALISFFSLTSCGKSDEAKTYKKNLKPLVYGEPSFKGDLRDLGAIGILTPTIYYKPYFDLEDYACGSADLVEMKDPRGNTLLVLCASVYRSCLIQGSCWIENDGDVRSFNYHSKIENVHRFVEVDQSRCKTGLGARGHCLTPFHAVAADSRYHPIGQVIFVPKVQGLRLPNGEYHSGYFVVLDRGGNISGEGRFDFYTGQYSLTHEENVFVRLGLSDPNFSFDYQVVTGETEKEIRELYKLD